MSCRLYHRILLIVKSAVHLHFGGTFFSLAVIGILFFEQPGIGEFTSWAMLGIPLFLSIGFSFIFPKGKYENTEADAMMKFSIKASLSGMELMFRAIEQLRIMLIVCLVVLMSKMKKRLNQADMIPMVR